MSEALMTQDTSAESVATPEDATGLSEPEGLPEEYKPYSMIPWETIPEEQREAVLAGVKKFHGGMTKGQQEAAKLKGQMAELSRKAELLDQLVEEPWVKAAWKQVQSGQSVPAVEPEKTPVLSDHLDSEAAKAIEAMVQKAIESKLGPLSSQLSSIGQEQANSRAKNELADLAKKAGDNGWPDPYERLDAMAQVVATGRAKSVEDAYRLATFEDVPGLVKEKTRSSVMEELKAKAGKTVSPTMGSSQNGKSETYSGRDSVLRAFRDAKRELGI